MNSRSLIATTSCLLAASLASSSLAVEAGETRPPIALKGLDPVALVEGKQIAGSERLEVVKGRFRYVFADEDHKGRFESDPSRFSIQGDATCTVMPIVPASPDLFSVYRGKIYAFASTRCLDAFEADPEEYFKPRRNVAILLYEGVELLDFAGPGEVFTSAGSGRGFRVYTVAASARPITSQGFATITPRYTFADCPRPDLVIVPGGATRIPASDPAVIGWVKSASKDAEVVLSVCSGALLLGKAGLLDGLEATTHRDSIATLRRSTPNAKVIEGRRYVDNGKVVTSAGVSAGIDASFHVVGRLLGEAAASDAARRMEYERRP